MKVGDILKNITEIQNPNWVKLMNDDDLNAFKKFRWLVWSSIKLIKDEEVMVKLSEHQTQLQQVEDNPSVWYSVLIDIIPKKSIHTSTQKRIRKRITIMIS